MTLERDTLASLLDAAEAIVEARLARLTADTTSVKDLSDSDDADYYRIFNGGLYELLIGNRDAATLRSDLRAAAKEYLKRAFVTGYLETSGAEDETEIEADDLAWIKARITQEYGFISQLVKDMRATDVSGMTKSEIRSITEARAEGYRRTLHAVYNEGRLRGARNQLLTWHYGDTQHCDTCQKLNGKKHRAKWYVDRNYIPARPGADMDCGGYQCQCYLTDKSGERFTL